VSDTALAHIAEITRRMCVIALRPESLTLTLAEIERLAAQELATEQGDRNSTSYSIR